MRMLNWDFGLLPHAELRAAIREFETDFVTKHGHKVHKSYITNKTKFITCRKVEDQLGLGRIV